VRRQSVENNCDSYDGYCADRNWRIVFTVQDEGTGLFRVTMKDALHRIPFWWKENHPVGGKEEIQVEGFISCCSQAVSLEVEDVGRNLLVAHEDSKSGYEPDNWDLIIGIASGVGVLVVIIIIISGVCICRRRYSSLPQSG